MIVLEYNSNKFSSKKNKRSEKILDKGPVVIVGKGVMFDSGGYNIKTGDFSDMKNDMTGSAIVYGLMKMIAESKVEGHFVGLLPLVENMIGSKSTRPGDIVKSYSGKTVEILDTDAEGRLILGDALAYAAKWKPSLCIDIATLTGQAASLFDGKSSVLVGTNNTLNQKMIQSGIVNQEKIWELPMWENYLEYTKSDIADYKNYHFESKAGILMGAAFIYNFVPKGSDWIHLDIAGVDKLTSFNQQIRHSGASGESFRSVFTFLTHLRKPIYANK
jgi:leucyl aminopeptidase